MFRLAVAVLALSLLAAIPAAAQDDVDVPPGYRFCGWKDFVNGGWTHDPPDGASLVLFARKMSCHTARRKLRKVRYDENPPYRPRLKNYRCVRLESGYEYEDARCSRRGHPKIALRWQTGS